MAAGDQADVVLAAIMQSAAMCPSANAALRPGKQVRLRHLPEAPPRGALGGVGCRGLLSISIALDVSLDRNIERIVEAALGPPAGQPAPDAAHRVSVSVRTM
jgi:hypothetical protein